MVAADHLLAPDTVEQVAEIVRDFREIVAPHSLFGSHFRELEVFPQSFEDVMARSRRQLRSEENCTMRLERLTGVVDFAPEDQVATFLSGTSLERVQSVLLEHGQCLPFANLIDAEMSPWVAGFDGILHDLVGQNLPHGNEYEFGNWRDWILGMKVVTATGSIATCGSHAVKNVAGYDLQRFMIGSRSCLAILVEVTLRTTPVVGLTVPNIAVFSDGAMVNWIQRVARSEMNRAVKACLDSKVLELHAVDEMAGTLWLDVPDDEMPARYENDWILNLDAPGSCLPESQIRLMKRAKAIFDPTNKLNPGEWGFI